MFLVRIKTLPLLLLCALPVVLTACGGGSSTTPAAKPAPAPAPAPVPPPTAAPSLPIGGFATISESEWTPVAVGKVLHTFALGGHATDAQILAWSQQHPVTAIQEILTFEPHNLKLSPTSSDQSDQLDTRDIALESLAQFWASDDPSNGMPTDRRDLFDYTPSNGWLEHLWPMAVTTRGMNPFIHKIAYFEANQHMAVNRLGVPTTTLIRYYDDIVRALAAGKNYDQVMAVAASSAAIAHQYGHRLNRFRNNQCQCNEDFAREIYQLFFGITGSDDPDYHETVTIKNTAKALSDMRIQTDAQGKFTPEIIYGSDEHPSGPLEMLGVEVFGTNAQERIADLASTAINHPESLNALPVMFITGLADDELSTQGEDIVRAAWASMNNKDLLLFLRAYAISPLFHNEARVKYWTSTERRLLVTNKISTSNDEIYNRVYSVVGHQLDGILTFRPVNNVFGGQTGDMAANSLDVFRQNFNQATERGYALRRYEFTNGDYSWVKDWRDIIPSDPNGNYPVAHVADYLWHRFVGDGGKNFGPLERAHIYALLGTNGGLAKFLDPDNLERVYSEADVLSTDIAESITLLGTLEIALNSSDVNEVETVSYQLGQAVNFITASPYMFYMEGK